MSEDERAIREVVRNWMTATREGDAQTVLSLMTDDVVFMVPGQEPFGKDAFAAASEGQSEMNIDGSNEIVELQVLGDWAFARAHLEVTMTPASGRSLRRAGYTLSLFRKEADGKWRLARDANLLAAGGEN